MIRKYNVLLFVLLISSNGFASDKNFMEGFPNWREWAEILHGSDQPFGLTEGHNCSSIIHNGDLSLEQQSKLGNSCSKLVFYESFDKDKSINFNQGNGTGIVYEELHTKYNHSILVGLYKWNITSGNVAFDTYQSGYTRMPHEKGYGIRLGNYSYNSGAKISTRGAINLETGSYSLSVKFKETHLHANAPKFLGIRAKVYSLENPREYEFVQYIKAQDVEYKQSGSWASPDFSFDIHIRNNYFIELEPIVSGRVDKNVFLGNVILYKK